MEGIYLDLTWWLQKTECTTYSLAINYKGDIKYGGLIFCLKNIDWGGSQQMEVP